MTIKMIIILAGAGLVLAGCGSSGSSLGVAEAPVILEPAEEPAEVVVGPLGLLLPNEDGVHATDVMSADAAANTVRVGDGFATITLNDLTFDEDGGLDTFSITFGLPDGSSVTLTDDDEPDIEDSHKDIGDTGVGVRLSVENENGDLVNFIIAFDHDTFFEDLDNDAEFAAAALYILARIDPDGDNPDFGFDTYMVSGAETDGLPEGSADYHGFTIASVYHQGVQEGNHIRGDVFVSVDFDDALVDIFLSGSDGDNSYSLHGDNLPIDGSGYGGVIAGSISADCFLCDSENAVGDVLGAFFGDDAEATAGVFGASGTDSFNHDVEVVGGFGASIDD